jgi:hypothetical protein
MGIKEELEKTGDHIKDAGKHLKDAAEKLGDKAKAGISEATHRVAAEGEHDKRVAAGDTMTGGEKIKSVANESRNNVQAEIDKAKKNS